MRRAFLLFASTALAVLLFATVPASAPPTAAREGPAGHNFVFVLADDMRKDDLNYMPKTRALLGDKGMRFTNAFVSYGLCCPSRATILRGQYAHNHGVWSNGKNPDAPEGGGKGSMPTATSRTTSPRASTTPATGPGSSANT